MGLFFQMKYYYVLSIFSGFVQVFSQKIDFGSHTTVKYEFTYQPDSTDITSVKTEFMDLYIGENQSLFENRDWAKYDSIIAVGRMTRHFNFDALPKFAVTFSIYSNNREFILADDFRIGKLKYVENKEILIWTIKNDTKIINNILCQKAVSTFGGRTYTAWFSKEIPLTEGPYKFKNLPGLVFEVYDSKNFFNFKLIEIKKEKRQIQKDYSKFISVPKNSYYKTKQNIVDVANARINRKSNITSNPIER